ncbi:putative disease resistance protein At5g05400 [Cajanus cajan]|uniref:putative disease resistance protein At5g05400 n=1 Tax=Cajanus cajan TaxID=3821 RepID=UPI00098DD00B|nr:putative disease resistance protein At5g05400 [Cajanus cajan]
MKYEDILKLLGKAWPYLKLLLKQLRSYESRVRELDKNVKKLRKEEKIVQNKVREEERHAKAIDDNVIEWLKKVKRVISEYENFCEDEDCAYAVFSDGYLPKPAIRYNLSVTVIDITKKVNELLQSAKHVNFSYWLGPPSFDADFDNIRYEEFESRKETMDDIKAALEDSNFGVIGVYGWSGVGKTSLIKEVAKRVKGFDVVIMVNISHPDIRSIQGQIADRLGMKLEEESESGRAARLRERLKNPKEKTLVILDNMRVKLDFNMVGIPLENNSHTSYKGCKVLMISDSEPLLISQTGEKGIQTFCVQALTEKEAEMMFKNMAKIGDGNSTFETLATKIAKECKGLPMVIVTTANALKGKSSLIWDDTHGKLQRQNLTAMLMQ